MKPALFSYYVPESLAEAAHWLSTLGYDAKLIAGGQSLMPMMNMRLARPAALIDLNALESELSYVRREGGSLRIGAVTRHYQLEEDPLIRVHCPILADAERLIGHPAIRSRGTIGGSLAHADPAAELPLAMVLLQADIDLYSEKGTRTVAAPEFFLSYLTTACGPDEIVTEIRVPVLKPGTGQALVEFSERHGDFALVAAAAEVGIDREGDVTGMRLALGGVAAVPTDVSHVLVEVSGRPFSANVVHDRLAALNEMLHPDEDVHASADYRRELARVMGRRALEQAYTRAVGKT